jgi:acetyl esterase/lipase
MRYQTRSVSGPSRATVTTSAPPATAQYKPYVNSTGAWSAEQQNMSIAFWALFGRVPERAAVAYWVGYVGSGATVAQCVDALAGAIDGQLILDGDNKVRVALIYHHFMGKEVSEDAEGQAYWTEQLNGGMSLGTFTSSIATAANGASGFHGDTFRHRLMTLESAFRLQAHHGVDLSIADSRVCVLRVVWSVASYESAMSDIYRLLVLQQASEPSTWAQGMTPQQLFDEGRVYAGSSIRQHRYLVWYNREGNMMLATAFIPANFLYTAQHRGIVALHGGGWRIGYPEIIYQYCVDFAPDYVVLAPAYRMTPYATTAPGPDDDVADFYALVYSAPRFKLFPGKLGIFGESSGGHLACLVGAIYDIPRVFALYPPIDLRGDPSVSADLNVFSDYYAPSDAIKSHASANVRWTPGRLTRFQLWHGTADTLVPSAQTGLMVSTAGAYCVARYLSGEGHGFSMSGRASVLAAAKRFFDDRETLDT